VRLSVGAAVAGEPWAQPVGKPRSDARGRLVVAIGNVGQTGAEDRR
jgi:hypothetical protein